MPYNTTAIPPRKEVTGQTLLPLSRVKKIVAHDPDINICSNNAAFAITVATEMFIQHMAEEALKQAKLERKPRRNIQYKDIANAIHHQDNLEFLEDLVPRTVKFKDVKAAAALTRAQLCGDKTGADVDELDHDAPNGKRHKSSTSTNGTVHLAGLLGDGGSPVEGAVYHNNQAGTQTRQGRDGDAEMSG